MTHATDPALSSPPLSEDFPSEWDWLGPIVCLVWLKAFGITLDQWQQDLLRRVLEVYPNGHKRAGELRFRQVVISLGRQNGKTEIAAVLGLYGLLRRARQLVIGIASSAEQARLVYKRTLTAIASNASLAKSFKRLTDTRGISAKTGGLYEIKAAKGAALQGLPVDVGVVDELHLLSVDLWTALVNGTGGRPNGLIVGITTAGDDNSELLIDLYKTGKKAVAEAGTGGHLERFGFFLWEAPESRVPEDDAELLAFLVAANPALASGRLDPQNILADVRAMPDADVIRYRLNRFIESTSAFMPMEKWAAALRPQGYVFPDSPPVFSIDRTPDWGYATVTAAVRDDEGITHTEVVASLTNPTLEQLVAIALHLYEFSPSVYVMDSYGLKELGVELKRRGLPVLLLTLSAVISGSAMFYAKTAQKKIVHAGDPLLAIQLPRTIRKNVGDSWRISRKDSSVEIDAVLSTVGAIYGAEVTQDQELQIF